MLLRCFFAQVFCLTALAAKAEFYTAAVYEHAVDIRASLDGVQTRDDALQMMYKNLDVLEQQVVLAKSQDADIFVFPENGLYKVLTARETAKLFAENIPDPAKDLVCPCNYSPLPAEGQEVLHRLSCVARKSSIYLAANMASTLPCSWSEHEFCRYDNLHLLNTEVVFDRKGCLVARYHKQNLVPGNERETFDVTSQIDYAYFDTEFGRFGVVICYDAFFKQPAIELVEKYHVTDIIFSTMWTDVNYNFNSVAYHSGWARTMKVNFLSANIHDIVNNRILGSGIYGPEGVIKYTYDTTSRSGKLLIGQVPTITRSNHIYTPKHPLPIVDRGNFNVKLPVQTRSPLLQGNFTSLHDNFNLRLLAGTTGTTSICMKNVCCSVSFTRSHTSEWYAVGAFDGMHHYTGDYYREICLLVRCMNITSGCGSPVHGETETEFIKFTLSGTMPTKYVFPEVITPDFDFHADWVFKNGDTKVLRGINKKLATVALIGRDFEKDSWM